MKKRFPMKTVIAIAAILILASAAIALYSPAQFHPTPIDGLFNVKGGSCGGLNQPCCIRRFAPCNAPLNCSKNNICLLECGRPGQPCCPNNYCASPAKCRIKTQQCYKPTPTTNNTNTTPTVTPTPSPLPTPIPGTQCIPLVYNGEPTTKFNFFIAYYNVSQEELDTKGFNWTRAQFYRSEYNKTDPDYGFTYYTTNPNLFGSKYYELRSGLFEMEPFKSNIDKFNVFYAAQPIPLGATNSTPILEQYCPMAKGLNDFTEAKRLFFAHTGTQKPGGMNMWELEGMSVFNHEIAHTFGLLDEYFTVQEKNNLTSAEVADWNVRLPNCDYGHPLTEADQAIGNGYCTKWCQGVNQSAYMQYAGQDKKYAYCASRLLNKTNTTQEKSEWMTFCMTMNFSRYSPSYTQNQYAQCEAMYNGSPKMYEKGTLPSINFFCYDGTIYNVWDSNLGVNCQNGTGCYAGCGGFPRDMYPGGRMGAFGDAMRSNVLSIMGGGPMGEMHYLNLVHRLDNQSTEYGAYDEQIIQQKINEYLAG